MPEAVFRISLAAQPELLAADGDVAAVLGFAAGDFASGKVALRDRIHRDDEDIAALLFSRTAAPATGSVNLRIRHADGRIRCIKGHYEKSSGAAGPLLELRLQDARSLPRTLDDTANAANFVAMMENTNDFIYFKDRNHVFTGASQTLVTLCDSVGHWTELIGKTDYDVFSEAYADAYYRLEKQVFAGTPVAHEVQETLTRDGTKGWVDNRKYPIHGPGGEIIGLFGVARDITETMRRERMLRESEQRFRRLFEQASNIPIQGYTPDFKVFFWNPASEEVYGYRTAEAIGRHIDELVVAPEDRPGFRAAVAAWVGDDIAIPAGELSLMHRDGRRVPVYSSHVKLYNLAGEPELYCVDVDLSGLKKAMAELDAYRQHLEEMVAERTQELEAAKEAAESASVAKSAFLANMSHEIRTPIHAITGMAHLIRREGLTPQQADRMSKLEGATAHLLDVINGVLDLSKIEAGKLDLVESGVSPQHLVAEVAALLHEAAAAKQITLVQATDEFPHPLAGDGVRLRQALLNYLGNAIKFTASGRIELHAHCIGEDADSMLVRFAVTDTGIGIPADVLPRLFSAFEQADNSSTRKYGGTGLGLAIVKKLAGLMGGEAGAESTPGAGSTFWFTARLRKMAAGQA